MQYLNPKSQGHDDCFGILKPRLHTNICPETKVLFCIVLGIKFTAMLKKKNLYPEMMEW